MGENMTQAIVNLGDREDRVLTIVKGKYGFKNKSEAMNFVIDHFEENHLEPELRPEYIRKLAKIEKEGYVGPFRSIEELRKKIESRKHV